MSRISVVFSTIFLMSLFACSSDVAQPESHAEAASTALSAEEPLASPQPTTAVLPAGTALRVRLAKRLSTRTNQSGDEFETLLDEDLVVDGTVVVPVGSKVTGKLLNVVEPGKVKGRAQMTLLLTQIQVGEGSYRIESNRTTIRAEGTRRQDAKVIGGATGVGALIGAIAGGKKGAAIGAATGGGAGTATVLMTKGKEVNLEPEREMSFRLQKELEVKLLAG